MKDQNWKSSLRRRDFYVPEDNSGEDLHTVREVAPSYNVLISLVDMRYYFRKE